MVVMPDGGFLGTIGGGALEWQAIAQARDDLTRGSPLTRLARHALGPELGQCCGGSVRLLTEVFERDRAEEVRGLAAAERDGPFETRAELSGERIHRNPAPRGEMAPGGASAPLEPASEGTIRGTTPLRRHLRGRACRARPDAGARPPAFRRDLDRRTRGRLSCRASGERTPHCPRAKQPPKSRVFPSAPSSS